MKTKTNVMVGGLLNHNQTGIAVRTKIKAGGMSMQHNQTGIAVRSKVKAGRIVSNHNQTAAIRPNQSRQAQTR